MLTIAQEDMVRSTPGGMTNKACKLVALWDRKKDSDLPIIVRCLRKGKHEHVADLLEDEGQ